MTGTRRLWSPGLRAAIGVLVALLLTIAIIYGAATGHLGDAANVAQIVALVLDLALLLVPLVRRAQQSATTEQLMDAADLLAEQVSAQWRTELGWRGMNDPEPIRTEWYPTHPDRRAPVSTTNVLPLVELLLGGRRLILVGDTGMGKTTLAALLLLEPDGRRAAAGPVPVLLRISDWDPSLLRFDAWLAGRLAEDYPALRASQFGMDATRQLVSRRLVLPILDGLDEAPSAARGLILTGLNRYLGPADPLVLTCRKEEYETTGEVLRTAEVYEAKPVIAKDVVGYLQSCITNHEAEWQALLTAPERTALRYVDSPFILWLVRIVYVDERHDPKPLADQFSSREALLDHLLDSLVATTLSPEPTGVADRPSAPRYSWDIPKATKYLEFIASRMTANGDPAFGWWNIETLVGRMRLRLTQFAAIVFFFTVLHATVIVAIVEAPDRYSWRYWLDDWWRIGFRIGFVNSIIVAIVLVVSYELDALRRVSQARTGHRPLGFAARLGLGLGVALACYTAIGTAYALITPAVGLSISLGGFGYGVAPSAILGFRASGSAPAATRASRSVQLAIRLAIFALLFLGFVWLAASSLLGDELAYSGWLTTGLLVASITNSQAQPRYATLRFRGRPTLTLRVVILATIRAIVPAALAFVSVMVPITVYAAITYESLDYGLRVASIVAATFAIAVWIVVSISTAAVEWATVPWPSMERLRFRDSLRHDRWSTLVRVVSTTLAILVCVLLGMLVNRASPDQLGAGFQVAENIQLFTGTGYVLPGVSMLVVVALLGSASAVFGVSLVSLTAARQLPIRLVAFLDDCRRVGLLREVGPRYEFRHAMLQKHLTAAVQYRRSQREAGKIAQQPADAQHVESL